MPDILTPQQRHRCMSHIRSKGTKPEMAVRKWLWTHGYRYRLNVRSVPGKPDIVMRRYRTAIFVNGCFWFVKRLSRTSKCTVHIWRSKCGARVCGTNIELLIKEGCKQFVLPKTNTAFWQAKIERNRERDRQNEELLRANGWQVITLWACSLTKDKLEPTMQQVAVALNHNLLRIMKQ